MNQSILQRVSFFSNIPAMAMSFLLPVYCIALGFSPMETTGLFAMVSIALLVGKVIVGNACDKYGRKKVYCLGTFLTAVSFCLLAFSQSKIPIYIAQTVKGVAISLVSVSMYAMLSDDRENNFAVRQSQIIKEGGKGQLFGVIICSLLLQFFDFQRSWKILLLIGAGFAMYAAYIANQKLVETKPVETNQLESNPEEVTIHVTLPRKFTKLFTASTIFSLATSIVDVILILYLSRTFTARTEFMACMLLIPAVILTYASPTIANIILKVGEKRAFFVGAFGAILVLVMIPFQNTVLLFAIVYTIYVLFASLADYAFDSIISMNSEAGTRGKVSGTFMASNNLGSFLGAIISGGVFQIYSPSGSFYLSAVVFGVLSIVMCLVLKNKEISIR